jgi:tol-pal system protein YbgF
MKSKQAFVLLIFLIGCFSNAFAIHTEAPVVDLSKTSQQDAMLNQGSLEIDQDDPVSSRLAIPHQNEPMNQRVLRLERQISNLVEMNVASKLEKMQQEVQQLQGQLDVQNHDMGQLKEQVRSFYQDLDQRLTKIQPDQSDSPGKNVLSAENRVKSVPNDPLTTSEPNTKTKELQTYEAAFNLLNKKEYDKAIGGFQSFVKDYPTSTYTVNAHYWMGEIFYLKGKPEQANKEFQIIIVNYPDSPKVADAMLKVALIAMDTGNYAKAKQHFTRVQKQFPGTTASKIATLRLKELKQKR